MDLSDPIILHLVLKQDTIFVMPMSIVVEHRPLSCYNQERHLLSVAGEIFRNCKGFEKSQFYKINEEL